MKLPSFVEHVRSTVQDSFTEATRATWSLRGFGLTKVPLLLYCLPSVQVLNSQQCVIKIPLNWRTRNHYKSMYFGALAVGADCAAGLMAMHHIDASGANVQLLFKDLHADFLRRPEGDVHFVCNDGPAVQKLVAQAIKTGERVNQKVRVSAIVPSQGSDPAATFDLTLSLKKARQ